MIVREENLAALRPNGLTDSQKAHSRALRCPHKNILVDGSGSATRALKRPRTVSVIDGRLSEKARFLE